MMMVMATMKDAIAEIAPAQSNTLHTRGSFPAITQNTPDGRIVHGEHMDKAISSRSHCTARPASSAAQMQRKARDRAMPWILSIGIFLS
jgi:hypothetical protein